MVYSPSPNDQLPDRFTPLNHGRSSASLRRWPRSRRRPATSPTSPRPTASPRRPRTCRSEIPCMYHAFACVWPTHLNRADYSNQTTQTNAMPHQALPHLGPRPERQGRDLPPRAPGPREDGDGRGGRPQGKRFIVVAYHLITLWVDSRANIYIHLHTIATRRPSTWTRACARRCRTLCSGAGARTRATSSTTTARSSASKRSEATRKGWWWMWKRGRRMVVANTLSRVGEKERGTQDHQREQREHRDTEKTRFVCW